ncbi:MAG: class I SAM-dependent methyltransferase [Erysipelotrichaceae bacterium]
MKQNYYDKHAQAYYEKSKDTDLSPIWDRFTALLESNATILDAGCGVGRDSKHFLDLGYEVDAFDSSKAMVEYAGSMTGIKVQHTSFQDFQAVKKYDGIWACASLLHVPREELTAVVSKLSSILKDGGIFYASFKESESDFTDGERLFTGFTMEALQRLLVGIEDLEIIDSWRSGDALANRESVVWLNVLCRKKQKETKVKITYQVKLSIDGEEEILEEVFATREDAEKYGHFMIKTMTNEVDEEGLSTDMYFDVVKIKNS